MDGARARGRTVEARYVIGNALHVGAGALGHGSSEIWLLGTVFGAEEDSAPVAPKPIDGVNTL
jgi:hypothetical protein